MNNVEDKIIIAEDLLKSLSGYEREGLDTSSLRLFIKSLKTFAKIQEATFYHHSQSLTFEEKLAVIRSFLEDKKLFPKISDVIKFANDELELGFKDQKESRETTIRRVIGRMEEIPELKETMKSAVMRIRNQEMHLRSPKRSKKEIERVETYARWAEILMKL